jgi:hypothetical protein
MVRPVARNHRTLPKIDIDETCDQYCILFKDRFLTFCLALHERGRRFGRARREVTTTTPRRSNSPAKPARRPPAPSRRRSGSPAARLPDRRRLRLNASRAPILRPEYRPFLSRDPIQDGDNWYVYCENDPSTPWPRPGKCCEHDGKAHESKELFQSEQQKNRPCSQEWADSRFYS